MKRPRWNVLPILACCLAVANAQEVIHVDARSIQQHADHKTFPVYPPIARVAGVQGTVVVDLHIGTDGRVASVKAVTGPAMLQQSAIDCMKQWTFHPFEKNGVPAIANGQYSIIFSLGNPSNTTIGHGPPTSANVKTVTVHVLSETAGNGPDAELNRKFNDADSLCKKDVLARQFNDVTTSACEAAAKLAEKLPMEGNYVAKRSAFVYASTAYGDVGDFKSALPWANEAVEVVKLGQDDSGGSSAAYSTRGTIEGLLGDLSAADGDLTVAEGFSRKGIAWVEKVAPSLRGEYVRPFVRDLQFHAKVLRALGKPDEAQKKLDEAAKYE